MKKLLLTLLITLSTNIWAKTPESLFGVYINDNVLDYVTNEELKSKIRDNVRGFYYVRLKNPPVSNKAYTDVLWLTFDKKNKIAAIQSEKDFQNSETCEKVEYSVRKALESKYDFELERNSLARYSFLKWVGDNVISSSCKVFGDNKTTLLITFKIKKYQEKFNEYLDSKI